MNAKFKKCRPTRSAREAALTLETEHELRDRIRRLLALPMNKPTHFLRVRHPGGGSHL